MTQFTFVFWEQFTFSGNKIKRYSFYLMGLLLPDSSDQNLCSSNNLEIRDKTAATCQDMTMCQRSV